MNTSTQHRLCYISRNYRGVNSSGNKAKTDNEVTLQQMGATNLGLPATYYDNKVITFFLDLAGILKMIFCIKKGDIVFLQYPVKKYFSFICHIAHLRHAKVWAVIHDLGSMRRRKLTVAKEIKRLNGADSIIASNEVMAGWLRHNGYKGQLGALGLFDYRSISPIPSTSRPSPYQDAPTLVYASAIAMRKNAFLLEMMSHSWGFHLDVYGNCENMPQLKETEHLHLHGFMDADKFISDISGDFGFVWDGDSLESCTGSFGEYLKWNSPHKVSFYLRAGLPVIIWKEAALASLIEKEHVGFCISSINELDQLLQSISQEEIAEMKANARKVAQRLAEGDYLKQALTALRSQEEGGLA